MSLICSAYTVELVIPAMCHSTFGDCGFAVARQMACNILPTDRHSPILCIFKCPEDSVQPVFFNSMSSAVNLVSAISFFTIYSTLEIICVKMLYIRLYYYY